MTSPMSGTACCRKCGYALVGNTANRCPECGETFDVADPKTFDRSPRSRAWRRRWRPIVLVVLGAALIYGIAPRGYVKGTLVYVPGGDAAQSQETQWRLAPPRWLTDVPYPYWTVKESGGQYLEQQWADDLGGASRLFRAASERYSWAGQSFNPNSVSTTIGLTRITPEIDAVSTREYARRVLDGLVRRQCRGFQGTWLEPDDDTFPVARDPWRFAPEEFRWIPP